MKEDDTPETIQAKLPQSVQRSSIDISEDSLYSGTASVSDQIEDALINSLARELKCKCKATALIVDDHEFNVIPLNRFLKN